MSLCAALAISVLYFAGWSSFNADGKKLLFTIAIIFAGGLAGMRD